MNNPNTYLAGDSTIRFPFTPGGFSEPSQAPEYISALISTLITFGIIFGIVFFVISFLLGALKWITSGGDKTRTQEAHEQIKQAVMGLVILLVFWGIIVLIETVFEISLTAINLDVLRIGE